MAAVLAAGPGALLSHRSAAEAWGLLASGRRRPEVIARTGRRAGPGVEVHHCALEEDERTALNAIPVTTVSRTLLDLAAVVPRQRLERALREAEVRRLGDSASLEVLLERYPRRRGTATMRSVLASGRIGDGVTRSKLEERFGAFLDDAALPRPRLNVHVEIPGRLIECDCLWRTERLIVELDGHAIHGRRAAFEDDRVRDRALHAAGWRVVRVTWRQLDREATALAADLRALLA
jgi:very-short-patch-repair endonuclease